MGSPLSPVMFDIVLQDLEEEALKNLTYIPPFYYRYVDDIVLAVPTVFDQTLNYFNSLHPSHQFSIEISNNNSLHFLDITLILEDNCLIFDWYHKPSYSGRYLSFASQHPVSQKRCTVIGLVDRAFRLFYPSFHQKNLQFIVNTLIENLYSLEFIFRVLEERLKFLIHNTSNSGRQISNNSGSIVPKFFTVPYVPGFSEKYKSVFKKTNIKLSYFSVNRLSKYIRVHKDSLPFFSHSNVVYKINYMDCAASYVGQTGRQLKTRILEHQENINLSSNLSTISEHRILLGHSFDWGGVEVLDREPVWRKRIISEMLFINRQEHSLNLHTDTECLPNCYRNVVDNLTKI